MSHDYMDVPVCFTVTDRRRRFQSDEQGFLGRADDVGVRLRRRLHAHAARVPARAGRAGRPGVRRPAARLPPPVPAPHGRLPRRPPAAVRAGRGRPAAEGRRRATPARLHPARQPTRLQVQGELAPAPSLSCGRTASSRLTERAAMLLNNVINGVLSVAGFVKF